jgi:hypothetical protein
MEIVRVRMPFNISLKGVYHQQAQGLFGCQQDRR